MGFLNDLLLTLIKALYSVVNNYALTIILFTVLIKLAVSPLNLKSRRSTMRMSSLQPKMKELQDKYKDDQEKLVDGKGSRIAQTDPVRWRAETRR